MAGLRLIGDAGRHAIPIINRAVSGPAPPQGCPSVLVDQFTALCLSLGVSLGLWERCLAASWTERVSLGVACATAGHVIDRLFLPRSRSRKRFRPRVCSRPDYPEQVRGFRDGVRVCFKTCSMCSLKLPIVFTVGVLPQCTELTRFEAGRTWRSGTVFTPRVSQCRDRHSKKAKPVVSMGPYPKNSEALDGHFGRH